MQLRRLPEMFDQLADGALADWFSRLAQGNAETVYERLKRSLDGELWKVADWLGRWADSLPPFDEVPPDFEGMRVAITDLVGKPLATAMLAGAEKLLKQMAGEIADLELKKLMDEAAAEVDAWADELRRRLQDPAATLATLQEALESGAIALTGDLDAAARKVQHELKDAFARIDFPDLQGSMDALGPSRWRLRDSMSTPCCVGRCLPRRCRGTSREQRWPGSSKNSARSIVPVTRCLPRARMRRPGGCHSTRL